MTAVEEALRVDSDMAVPAGVEAGRGGVGAGDVTTAAHEAGEWVGPEGSTAGVIGDEAAYGEEVDGYVDADPQIIEGSSRPDAEGEGRGNGREPFDPLGRLSRQGRNILAAALAVLIIALAVGLGLVWNSNREANDARTQALAVSKVYGLELSSYDYHHLDSDFGLVLAHATPSFAKSFQSTSGSLKSVLVKYQASVKATIVAAGLESASSSRAVALLFVDQTVTNTKQTSGPTTDRLRLELTMLHSSKGWQINSLNLR